MIEFFSKVNPIVLDVVVIALLVLIAFFGVIKGIKNSMIDFAILCASLFLGFCPYSTGLKTTATKLFNIEKLAPAGSNNTFNFTLSLFSELVASLIVFLLFYIILHVIKLLINIIAKRKRKDGVKNKSAVGRVFAGLFSLVYGGALTLVVLFCFNTNIIGMKGLISESTVTKFLVNKSDELLDELQMDLTDTIVIKVYNGDVLYEVEDELIASFNSLDENIEEVIGNTSYLKVLEDEKVSKETANKVLKDMIYELNDIAIISNHFDDKNEALTEKFNKLAEDWLVVMDRTIKNNNLGKVEIAMNERGNMRLQLQEAGVKGNVLAKFDEVVVGK